MKEYRRDCLYKVIFCLILAIALVASLICYFNRPKEEAVYTVTPSKIEVENPSEGVEITVLEDGIKVVRDMSIDDVSTDSLYKEILDGNIVEE